MPKHHTEDYKLTAVKYYLKNNTTYKNVCDIFMCSEISLKRWIIRYEKDKSIKRHNRKPISYKITKEQVKYALILLKQNQQITMTELVKLIKKRYKEFDITPQWLGKVLRDNNKTRKRKETKSKKYGKILLGKKKTNIDDKTIIEYETELCKYNRKTLDINKFKEYCKVKNKMNYKLFEFYKKELFRKLKLNGYWNRLKSEQKLINQFKKIFGNEKETIICFGDYEQRKHMKFKEPIKGKGMRTLFRKNGYKTYLVDEFRTSCKCSKCDGGKCEKFMVRENPKPFRDNLRLVHGLLSCKNCANVWNRDCNGATNIYKIASNSINKIERSSYLCRNSSGVLDDTSKSKFTRSETSKLC